ncbi:cytochrome d ubiquinol oxidase subunit II [Halothiobacillus sp. DCM-1]|uniref:cytochrome d ubiquinol oxidase subunit II n=1 Tax=Halothiobacillus sp. DCM-1 TaxID=3112558 RepID=UPI003250CBDD
MELYFGLKLLWWLLLGVLLLGLAVMVGMDMGVGALLRVIGKTDLERRTMLNAIGPHWDGNQVWFILGGGAIFAAFPLIYATAFSGLYVVMLLLLWSMIMRPLAFEYRSKISSAAWRNTADWVFLISGALPMIIYGAAMGNMLQGVPFHFDWDLRSYYTGSFLSLFNPLAILAGVLSLSLAMFMGANMIAIKTDGVLAERARKVGSLAAFVAIALFAIGGVWISTLQGFTLTHSVDPALAQTPLTQTVTRDVGGLLANYRAQPLLWVVPILGFAGMLLGGLLLRANRPAIAWWMGVFAWVGVLGATAISLFPFLMPSSSNPDQSLTIWNSISSQTTLLWMTGFSAVFVPLILWYTSWAFYVMRGKVDSHKIEHDPHAY